ncbi:MAG: hypothetical protein DWQ02_17185 [Bacteroidetes bacterium]|nr:MAG: hypothetical protein DWQ02_17185 [Bacteroidota bacterium]
MSQQHPIDELFRQKLENHAFEPPMQLWEKIDQQRNRRRILLRRGLAGRLLVLSGVVIAISVAGFFAWDQFRDQGRTTDNEIAFLENEHIGAFFHDDLAGAPGQVEKQTNQELKVADVDEKITNNNPEPVESKVPVTNSKEIAEVGKTVFTDSKANKVEKNAIALVEEVESGLTAETNVQQEQETLNAEEIEFDFSRVNNTQNVVDLLPLTNKLLSKEAMGSAGFPKRETDCPTFGGLPGGLYLDMNASVDLAQRTMTARDPEMEDYLLEREKSEIPYFAFSAGLHLTALSERGFALKSGVDYSQINESFNFDGGEVEIITIIEGDTTWEIKNLRIRATNRYQMVDIPLLAGYEHNFANFSLSVYGGAFLNVKFAKKGNIVSNETETMQPVGITTGEPEKFAALFKDKLGLGWYTSFGFGYKLQHGTQIRVEPYFRFYPKSFSAVDNVIDQRYFLTGIKLGLRKRL